MQGVPRLPSHLNVNDGVDVGGCWRIAEIRRTTERGRHVNIKLSYKGANGVEDPAKKATTPAIPPSGEISGTELASSSCDQDPPLAQRTASRGPGSRLLAASVHGGRLQTGQKIEEDQSEIYAEDDNDKGRGLNGASVNGISPEAKVSLGNEDRWSDARKASLERMEKQQKAAIQKAVEEDVTKPVEDNQNKKHASIDASGSQRSIGTRHTSFRKSHGRDRSKGAETRREPSCHTEVNNDGPGSAARLDASFGPGGRNRSLGKHLSSDGAGLRGTSLHGANNRQPSVHVPDEALEEGHGRRDRSRPPAPRQGNDTEYLAGGKRPSRGGGVQGEQMGELIITSHSTGTVLLRLIDNQMPRSVGEVRQMVAEQLREQGSHVDKDSIRLLLDNAANDLQDGMSLEELLLDAPKLNMKYIQGTLVETTAHSPESLRSSTAVCTEPEFDGSENRTSTSRFSMKAPETPGSRVSKGAVQLNPEYDEDSEVTKVLENRNTKPVSATAVCTESEFDESENWTAASRVSKKALQSDPEQDEVAETAPPMHVSKRTVQMNPECDGDTEVISTAPRVSSEVMQNRDTGPVLPTLLQSEKTSEGFNGPTSTHSVQKGSVDKCSSQDSLGGNRRSSLAKSIRTTAEDESNNDRSREKDGSIGCAELIASRKMSQQRQSAGADAANVRGSSPWINALANEKPSSLPKHNRPLAEERKSHTGGGEKDGLTGCAEHTRDSNTANNNASRKMSQQRQSAGADAANVRGSSPWADVLANRKPSSLEKDIRTPSEDESSHDSEREQDGATGCEELNSDSNRANNNASRKMSQQGQSACADAANVRGSLSCIGDLPNRKSSSLNKNIRTPVEDESSHDSDREQDGATGCGELNSDSNRANNNASGKMNQQGQSACADAANVRGSSLWTNALANRKPSSLDKNTRTPAEDESSHDSEHEQDGATGCAKLNRDSTRANNNASRKMTQQRQSACADAANVRGSLPWADALANQKKLSLNQNTRTPAEGATSRAELNRDSNRANNNASRKMNQQRQSASADASNVRGSSQWKTALASRETSSLPEHNRTPAEDENSRNGGGEKDGPTVCDEHSRDSNRANNNASRKKSQQRQSAGADAANVRGSNASANALADSGPAEDDQDGATGGAELNHDSNRANNASRKMSQQRQSAGADAAIVRGSNALANALADHGPELNRDSNRASNNASRKKSQQRQSAGAETANVRGSNALANALADRGPAEDDQDGATGCAELNRESNPANNNASRKMTQQRQAASAGAANVRGSLSLIGDLPNRKSSSLNKNIRTLVEAESSHDSDHEQDGAAGCVELSRDSNRANNNASCKMSEQGRSACADAANVRGSSPSTGALPNRKSSSLNKNIRTLAEDECRHDSGREQDGAKGCAELHRDSNRANNNASRKMSQQKAGCDGEDVHHHGDALKSEVSLVESNASTPWGTHFRIDPVINGKPLRASQDNKRIDFNELDGLQQDSDPHAQGLLEPKLTSRQVIQSTESRPSLGSVQRASQELVPQKQIGVTSASTNEGEHGESSGSSDSKMRLGTNHELRSNIEHPAQIIASRGCTGGLQYRRADCRFVRDADAQYTGLHSMPDFEGMRYIEGDAYDSAERARAQVLLEQTDALVKAMNSTSSDGKLATVASVELPRLLNKLNYSFLVYARAMKETDGLYALDGIPVVLVMLVRIVELLDILVGPEMDFGTCASGHVPTPGACPSDILVQALSECAGPNGLLVVCATFLGEDLRPNIQCAGTSWSHGEIAVHAAFAVRLLISWIPPLGVPRPSAQLLAADGHSLLMNAAANLLNMPQCCFDEVAGSFTGLTIKIAHISLILDALRLSLSSEDGTMRLLMNETSGGAVQSFKQMNLTSFLVKLADATLQHLAKVAFVADQSKDRSEVDRSKAMDAATAGALLLLATLRDVPISQNSADLPIRQIASSLARILAARPLSLRVATAIRELVANPPRIGWFPDRSCRKLTSRVQRALVAENVACECVQSARRTLEAALAAPPADDDGASTTISAELERGALDEEAERAAAKAKWACALYGHVEAIVRSIQGDGACAGENVTDLRNLTDGACAEQRRRGSTCSVNSLSSYERDCAAQADDVLGGLQPPEPSQTRANSLSLALSVLRRNVRRTCIAPYLRR